MEHTKVIRKKKLESILVNSTNPQPGIWDWKNSTVKKNHEVQGLITWCRMMKFFKKNQLKKYVKKIKLNKSSKPVTRVMRSRLLYRRQTQKQIWIKTLNLINKIL
jgi:hypothetical protein